MRFKGIICAYVLPASGWFQPGSRSCCVAENRRNDGEMGLLPHTLKHSSGLAAPYSPACYSRVNFWCVLTYEIGEVWGGHCKVLEPAALV